MFLDAYCIIPLISKATHEQYYTKKLTSSVSYGLAYKLKFLVDDELQDIYRFENSVTYDAREEEDMARAFKDTLLQFGKP
jgi:2-methylcitrate dehydratase PrpD